MGSIKDFRKKFHSKFQRTPEQQKLVYLNILQSQQIDVTGELADTLLVCNGGTIRAHGFLLQQASPFIQNCFASQGENYPFTREILLPDFSVQDMQNFLGLIYKGFVNLWSEFEVVRLQDMLQFFQVSGVDFGSRMEKSGSIVGSLKVQPCNRIPLEIFNVKVEKQDDYLMGPVVIVEDDDKDESPTTSSKPKRMKLTGAKLGNGNIKTEKENDPAIIDLGISSDEEEFEKVSVAWKQQQETKVHEKVHGSNNPTSSTAAAKDTPEPKVQSVEHSSVVDVSSGEEDLLEPPLIPGKPKMATIGYLLSQKISAPKRTRSKTSISGSKVGSSSATAKPASKLALHKNNLKSHSSAKDKILKVVKPPAQPTSCRRVSTASTESLVSNEETEIVAGPAKKLKREDAVTEKLERKK